MEKRGMLAIVIILFWILIHMNAPFWTYVILVIGYGLKILYNCLEEK